MKGLLLKDLYMMKAYCKSYVLMFVVFLAASFFGGNMFFIYYPCMISGMIPVNLLSFDEQSRFIQYSASLPVSRALIVSEKYLLGLISQAAVLIVTGIAQWIRMSINGTFAINEFIVIILSLQLVSFLVSSIPLPLIFKNGVEKGRIVYYVMIGIVCGFGALFSQAFKENLLSIQLSGFVFMGLMILGIGLYVLSWYLSVVFYKKREL